MPGAGAEGRRSVLVTGGSRGLGLAIAQKLAAAGYRTIAVARKTGKELTAAIAQAEAEKRGAIHFVPCDLGVIDGIADLARRVRDEFGADVHRRTRHVVDDHRLAPGLAEFSPDEPRQDVGRRARQRRHYDLDHVRWEGIFGSGCNRCERSDQEGSDEGTHARHIGPRQRAFAQTARPTIENRTIMSQGRAPRRIASGHPA